MKSRKLRLIACSLVATSILAGRAGFAAEDTKTHTVEITLSDYASLSLAGLTGDNKVTFADTAPGTDTLTAVETVAVTIDARTSASGNVTLTVQADGPLTSGTDTIGIDNLTWVATTGTGGGTWADGTMSSSTPQSLYAGTGSGQRTGTVSYRLQNARTYAKGTYSAELTYTLASP